MTTNRKIAEQLFTQIAGEYLNDSVSHQEDVDAIEAALDEAEKSTWQSRAKEAATLAAKRLERITDLNAILDKVVEMDRCSRCEIRPTNWAHNIACPDCNDTDHGEIAHYVTEARGE